MLIHCQKYRDDLVGRETVGGDTEVKMRNDRAEGFGIWYPSGGIDFRQEQSVHPQKITGGKIR